VKKRSKIFENNQLKRRTFNILPIKDIKIRKITSKAIRV